MKERNHLSYYTRQDIVDNLLQKDKCDSISLYFSKFPYIAPKIKDFSNNKEEKQIKTKTKEIEQEKQKDLKKICDIAGYSKKDSIADFRFFMNIPGAISFTAKNKGRLLVNHTGGIMEWNLALHRFFGCPVIPGSALKGIARNAARFDEDTKRFDRVFGGAEKGKSDNAGSVAFLMAFPENKDWKLVVDVLTSHGGSDTQNPVPVFFPAVETGATFRFTIAPTARTKEGDLEFAIKYLKLALSENGVGAKTAAGYGWFELDADKIATMRELDTDKIATMRELDLPDYLSVVFSDSEECQKIYLERMIKASASLIRKWKKKGNPKFEQIDELAQKFGMELPLNGN